MKYYENWLKSGKNWMKAYRRQLLRKYTFFIFPSVTLILVAVSTFATASSGGTSEDIISVIFTGILLGAFICGIFLLILLPGLSPKRISWGIRRAVKLLGLNEAEQERLGHEMLDAQEDPSRLLDYKVVGPNSKGTPARFILSPNYACLWGGYPLVILVDLTKLADVTAEEELKTAVTHGSTVNTHHRFNLHTITFYYKNSEYDGDNCMGFFDEKIRDKVFNMLQTQRSDPTS